MENNNLLRKLHEIIDIEFKRTDRSKYVNPYLLKSKITLFCLSKYFIDENPTELVFRLKELIKRGSVISNINDNGVNPFDAYVIPKQELLDETEFDTYTKIKKQLL